MFSLLFDQNYHWQYLCNLWPYSIESFFIFGTWLIHFTTFWGMNLMFFLLYKTKIFSKYKIPRKKEPSPELVKKCLRDLLINHLIFIWIFLFLLLQGFLFRGVKLDSNPPSWITIITEVIISFIINDFLFYWAHRTFHHPKLYARFHKQHHEFNSSIGITAEYAGIIESIFANSLPTVLGPIILGSHPYTFWIYFTLRIWETIESHSGYDFPWSIWSLFDWQGGAQAHDFHHAVNKGNYGGVCFSFWDTLMGTDAAYRKFLQEKSEKKE